MNFNSKYIVFGLLFSCILFMRCTSNESKIKMEIRESLLGAVNEINSQSPVIVNDTMQIDSCVLHANNDITYFYSLRDTIILEKAYFVNIEKEAKEIYKNDSRMMTIRNYGITAKYNYSDTKGNYLFSFVITPEDYR